MAEYIVVIIEVRRHGLQFGWLCIDCRFVTQPCWSCFHGGVEGLEMRLGLGRKQKVGGRGREAGREEGREEGKKEGRKKGGWREERKEGGERKERRKEESGASLTM